MATMKATERAETSETTNETAEATHADPIAWIYALASVRGGLDRALAVAAEAA